MEEPWKSMLIFTWAVGLLLLAALILHHENIIAFSVRALLAIVLRI